MQPPVELEINRQLPATEGCTAAQAQAYTNLVENRSRGTTEPPPIWTNPITEAAVLGTNANAFLVAAPFIVPTPIIAANFLQSVEQRVIEATLDVGRT